MHQDGISTVFGQLTISQNKREERHSRDNGTKPYLHHCKTEQMEMTSLQLKEKMKIRGLKF